MIHRRSLLMATASTLLAVFGGAADATNLGFETGYEAGSAADYDGRSWPPAVQVRPARASEFDPLPTDSRVETLVAAVRAGDPVRVKALLAEGAAPNGTIGPDGVVWRPLLAAAALGDGEIARLLLEKGAAVDVKGPTGHTALGIAALRGHAAMVRLLLQAGANIDARSDNGNTPLLDAVQLNRLAVVKALLPFGPDLERANREGLPAVALAARDGHAAVLAALLDHGADVDIVDRSGYPALFWAVAKRQRATVALLVERGAQVGVMSVDVFD